ncbi:MAG: hypothetical protein JY451_03880 [Erythrobacter sp.]|nr:MAG: hypothetical protein JY451_03880 [Erythrobacter sp.]
MSGIAFPDRPLARLPRWGALVLLALLAGAMAWAAVSVGPVAQEAAPAETADATELDDEDGGDLALYRRISERVTAGEGYYPAAMAEQRAGNYPTRPFVTVRLPTLATLHAIIGLQGANWLAMGLLLSAILLFIHRLRALAQPAERIAAGVLLLLGGAAAITPEAGLIHELLAGLLLTLALALYDPARWWPALLVAGLALAVRELALPFVLLWLAFALVDQRWKEAAGIAALLLVFAVGMYLHYLGVEAQRLPEDAASQGWAAFAGYSLPLYAIASLTALLFLPTWLAAPLAILPLLGWLGLGGRLGLFATLWFAGFLTMVALFARPENFYWVQLTLPALFAGFAFVPRALADLATALRGGTKA